MNETIFEQVEAFASVLKLDLSAEEFVQFAEDQELSEAGMEAVRAVFSYLSRKKQQTLRIKFMLEKLLMLQARSSQL